MQTPKTVGYDVAKIAAHIVMNSGLIPCFVGQSGIGKTSIVRDMAKEIGIPEWEDNPDHEGPCLSRYLTSCMLPEDNTGIPVPSMLEKERKTVFAKPEKVLHAKNYPDLCLFDEIDRPSTEATLASFIAGFAEKPFQIGGLPLHPEANILATMNGDTDIGTYQPPEALCQRMFFIYVVPSQFGWCEFMRSKHDNYTGLVNALSSANTKFSRSWSPRDYAGEAQRYERSADQFLEVFNTFLGCCASKDLDEDLQDDVLDVLGIGKLGCAYWTEVREIFKAKAWLDRWGVNAEEVLHDPCNANLLPDGCALDGVKFLNAVNGMDAPQLYIQRLKDEDQQAIASYFAPAPVDRDPEF